MRDKGIRSVRTHQSAEGKKYVREMQPYERCHCPLRNTRQKGSVGGEPAKPSVKKKTKKQLQQRHWQVGKV